MSVDQSESEKSQSDGVIQVFDISWRVVKGREHRWRSKQSEPERSCFLHKLRLIDDQSPVRMDQ